MAMHRITRRDFETFTLSMTPKRTYTSGSAGITGSITLFARGSDIEKDVYRLSAFDDVDFDDNDLDSILTQATGSNIEGSMEEYMALGNEKATTLRNSVALEVIRQTPPVAFAEATLKKRAITEQLMPYYRSSYPSAHFAYSNYHSLNFFTGSETPEDCTIMYPNGSGEYNLTGAFTFDFYVNPRRTFEDAGTIFFLSSSYCVSLHTGSQVDHNGETNRFRLALQLTSSTDVNPRDLVANDYAFFSDDNSLKRNHWHHCAIRWGNSSQSGGSGSFIIDGIERGTFNIPSATLNTSITGTVLAIGNYLEGSGHEEYFNARTSQRDGLTQLSAATADPSTASPAATLNAEVHDLKIYKGYRSDSELLSSSLMGPDPDKTPATTNSRGLIFYLPPFFRKTSPTRAFVDTHGGVKQTPFYEIDGTTTTPFNANLSFGVNGLEINAENFLFDFANENDPRLFNLTGSVITDSSELLTADSFMMATGSFVRRHYLIMPNDNGRFTPDYDWITGDSTYMTGAAQFSAPLIDDDTSFYVNDLGVRAGSFINLRHALSGVVLNALDQESGSLFDGITGGVNPDSMIGTPGDGLAIYERTRDPSSNEIVWFDISNLFYGHSIRPESLLLKDTAMTGVADFLSMSLRDDGQGNVFRADCETPWATWNMVGNIFYNEGIVLLKSPHVGHFGNEGFSIEFEGETTAHTLTIHALAGAGLVNSSSNGSYAPITSSLAHQDATEAPVMITGVNFYDKNLNVVMRTNTAQPIFKRNSDRMLFKPKVDF